MPPPSAIQKSLYAVTATRLPERVLWRTVRVPEFQMPPPEASAGRPVTLPERVLSLIVMDPRLTMPPPPPSKELLFEKVVWLTVADPVLSMAPPDELELPEKVLWL